ncbi:hypothetical protein PFBG_00009 [Plasmodium falciparum 7G8]|uniref:Erythrocyte membrane protein 1 n=5 Tax=Plasmodium falciparum TaxID=5833 RepID=W7FVB8_PLAF8|nr:hypothetical protein PFBG_00009 [Plasmodium falciparum 7G8]
MGGNSSKGAPTYYTNESEKSARNVLENFAKDIKGKASNDAKKKGISLKGYLRQAKFYHDFSKLYPNYRSPCDLNFWFHTNVWKRTPRERDPCYRRQPKNNPNLEGAVCTNSKIKGNENKIIDIGACAPYRRRNICDYNLEHLNERNVLNTHDLLGNVLVMAKREGESIVNSQANNGTLNVCTALARSFADIGDIVRGTDLFLGGPSQEKKKLEENLKKIFENIKNKNTKLSTLTLEKVREYWWALNRNDVWKALTCSAPYEAQYFIKSSDKKHSFSSEYCGHYKNGDPLTNLDYVPQFLRWFEEWSEEFCRLKKMKFKLAKGACRNDEQKLYCSHNGYDCTKPIEKRSSCSRESKCTDCLNKCIPYEYWLEKQQNEFKIQKEKYENEIKTYESDNDISNSNINNEYYEDFYKKLMETQYKTVEDFLKLLNEGKYCKGVLEGGKDIDFTMTGDKDAFYRSDYCQVCPDCVVKCDGKTCAEDTKDNNCRSKIIEDILRSEQTTEIDVLYSGNGEGVITEKLKDFCSNPNNDKGKNYKKWKCYNKNNDYNNCEMISSLYEDKNKPNVMLSVECFHSWAKNLLIDTIRWEHQLKNCINNTNVTDCKSKCNSNCECYEKWIKEKEKEWQKVKNVIGNKDETSHNYYDKLKDVFDRFLFPVRGALEEDEKVKWDQFTEDLKKKIDSSKKSAGTGNSQDAIEFLLDHLKDNASICKDNNTNEGCDPSVDPTQNPCAKPHGKKHATVKQIAQYYKRKAHVQLEERGGRRALKGDATRGTYNLGGQGNTLNGDICKITKNHTNDSRPNGERCTGKDKVKNGFRLKIGTPWTKIVQKKKKKSYKEVYLPPRRQHMCTSNLEYLETKDKPLNGAGNGGVDIVNHSFLGDVLLSAKFEADFIKKKYKYANTPESFKDNATICQAIRYIFADIGDIIKGTDLWEANPGEKNTQRNLQRIFGKIKEELPKDIKGKYTGTKHLKLRSDWWEANRAKVWEAMKCKTNGVDITCDSDHTPLDDYIPQRLRWMTEWAEWFCKMQSQEYEKLKVCEKCMDNGKCTQGDVDCGKCKPACENYKKFIKKWQPQWDKIRAKYKILYEHARVDIAANGGLNTSTAINDNEDKPVIEFLFELYKANGGKIGNPAVARATVNGISTDDTTPTVYSTPEGYIHQELPNVGCVSQKFFCNTNGNEDKYVFREKPKDHDEACGCNERNPKPPAPKPLPTPNPCVNGGDNTGVGKITSVKQVAEEMQKEVHEGMLERSVKEGDKGKSGNSCLVGNIKEAKFGKAAKSSDLDKGKICDLDEHKHTNAENSRGYRYEGPCTGKNQGRFNIGTEWSYKNDQNKKTHPEAYMPPRREHMCTSNLEHLDIRSKGLTGTNAGHSLLGDVLLAAKYEAENIKKLYQQNEGKKGLNDENDKATVCRAMKYSFADIGDIIRGKDLWDLPDFKKLEGYLVTIFEKIKDELKSKLNGKYNSDNDGNKYINLRKDWWEANRDQIWEAMKCKTTNGEFPCSNKEPTPIDDYIPQRLRWMTEWAEWYCKEQSRLYGELVEKCNGCRSGICEKECEDCRKKCKEYEEKIKPWREQWEKIKDKYKTLYDKATKTGEPITSGDSKDEKDVVDFFQKLHEKNSDNTIYATAAGYVHQELTKLDCNIQNVFCQKSDSDNKNYAFEPYPYDYKDKCNCKNDNPAKEKKKEYDDVCETVKEHIGNNNGTQAIEHCKPKTEGSYPGWNCTDKIKQEEKGACMPPRRIKLCVINLQHFNGTSKNDLREAFIKCAAAETFWLWHKYKEDTQKEKATHTADNDLNKGIIPDDFKRQMFYTFGDYRDLCLGKDMGSDVIQANQKIYAYFSKNTDPSNTKWWDENGAHIWEGMLCALSHASGNISNVETIKNNNTYANVKFSGDKTTTLEEFAKRPQFLRWMTEWSEHFCKKQSQEYNDLVNACQNCMSDKTCKQCSACTRKCKAYTKFVKEWEKDWETQRNKYSELYDKATQNGSSSPKASKDQDQHVIDYFKTLNSNGTTYSTAGKYVEKEGYIKDCHNSKQNNFDKNSSTGNNDNYAFKEYPHDHKTKCNCPETPPPLPPPPPPPRPPSGPPGDSGHDQRGRAEPGEDGVRPPVPVPQPAQEEGSTPKEEEETATEKEVPKGPPATPKDDVNVCEIVDGILNGKNENTTVGLCKKKDFGGKSYPDWQCDENSKLVTGNGECMPPRRIKLCLYFLAHQKEKRNLNKKEDLRKAFIKCAAAETFFSWYYFKKINDKANELDGNLKKGQIPPEFLRSMFYTFGDYKDICLDTDISAKTENGDITKAKSNIDRIIPKKSAKNPDEERKIWWDEIKNDVWKGMLCGLSHAVSNNDKATVQKTLTTKYPYHTIKFSGSNPPTLEEFAQRPQFLRWMTEWGEDFCKKRKEQVDILKGQCTKCDVSTDGSCERDVDGCKKCREACKKYQEWLEKWRENYDKQKQRYTQVKETLPYNNDKDVTISTHAYEYLSKKLTNIPCTNGITSANCEYKCMEGTSKQPKAKLPNGSTDDMPASLDDEPKEVSGKCTCPPTPPKSKPTGGGGVARSLPPADRKNDLPDSEEEDDADDEDKDEDVETAAKRPPQKEAEAPVETKKDDNVEKVCDIVKTALGGNLDEACNQKYSGNNSRLGWKCVTPSGNNTTTSGDQKATDSESERPPRQRRNADPAKASGTNQGSICVPPRRRKLYIGKIKKWAEENSALSSETPQGGTSSAGGKETPSDKLRTAFIESAAIETFFAWHKFKKDKEKKKPQDGAGAAALAQDVSPEVDPQKELQESGKIPEDFLRLMFYTLGDYRDICVGNTDVVIKGSSGDKEMQERESKIKDAINNYFSNNGNKQPPSGKPQDKRKTWWDANVESIWNAMVCALTYKENGAKGKPPQQDKQVKEKLWDDNTKKPKKNAGPESNIDYTYENVVLKEDKNSVPKSNDPLNNPKLTEFVVRPTYFRYLEEWGQNFCKERKKRLEKIEVECTKDGDGKTKKCSGDGLNCIETVPKNEEIFNDFFCSTCAIHCRSYRKWIERKKDEFTKQGNAYNEQKKYKTESESAKSKPDKISDSEFLQNLKKHGSIDLFLQKLGPCKNENGEDKKGDLYINFGDKDKAFKHTDYCDPCSQFKIKCENGKCTSGGINEKCDGKMDITAEDIKKINDSNNVFMLVSDESTAGFPQDLNDCDGADIFKGIRKDEWKCRNVCGVDICTLEKINNGKDEKYIIMKEFLKRWLEFFFEDYNRIKHKISHCIKNGKESKCICGCKKKCDCVEKWIEKKQEEWQKINSTYLKKYKPVDDGSNNLKSFLEQGIFESDKKKAIKPCDSLTKFESFCGLNGTESSKKSKDGKKTDIVECLLHKLEKEATSCPGKRSGQNPETECQESPSVGDDDDEPMEGENPVTQPNICPAQPPSEPVEAEETCEESPRQTDVKKEEEEKEEEKDKGDEEEEDEEEEEEEEEDDEEEEESDSDTYHDSYSETEEEDQNEDEAVPESLSHSEPQPKGLPREFPSTQLKNAMLFSTILWMVGIGFAAFTYFFLKKKPKSPVDLIRVLDVHKGDYEMPTLKSKNRYIPYRSGQYKGKTYIYMEGDSGDDDKYMFLSDTTDITSSESEYEEMDINDIYVPDSPKYKTLIEVVLEPSKRDTPSSDTPMNKFTDEEWNELKRDFISQYIQSESLDVPQYDVLKELPMNIGGNVLDDGINEKPFITSIHDRDLYSGEEYSYNIHMSTNTNNDIPISGTKDTYSGIDLINDSLSGEPIDIYDEVLKRKENELFGTNYKKNTSNNSVAKNTNNDPIMNQLDLLHKWLDRHRDMCEKWKSKEDILHKLNEQWNKDNNSGDIPNDNKMLNTDVSIQIDMDDGKPKKEFINMDTILDDMEDDIYYDVNDENPSVNDIPMDHNKVDVDVPKKVHVEMKILNNTSNGSLEQEFPISDVWNI